MNELRFCNNCGAIIVGIKCTKCFGMDLTSTRSRLLNKELFSPVHNINSRLTNELDLERKTLGPIPPKDLDISKKISENKLNAVKKEIDLPKVVEDLSSSAPLKGNTAEKILVNQDPIRKARNDWVNSVKNDVNILTTKNNKNIIIDIDELPVSKEIPEEKKYKIK